jgi:ATP-binding cassette subfamily B multidrug efflux pump
VLADVLVAMAVYVATMVVLAGAFDLRLVAPFIIWLGLYIVAVLFCAAAGTSANAGRRPLADDRAHHGRYTNINTVKLFSHTTGKRRLRARQGVHENRAHANASGQRL